MRMTNKSGGLIPENLQAEDSDAKIDDLQLDMQYSFGTGN